MKTLFALAASVGTFAALCNPFGLAAAGVAAAAVGVVTGEGLSFLPSRQP